MEPQPIITPPAESSPRDSSLKQSLFVSLAIIIAGAMVAGAVLYNGAHYGNQNAGQTAGAGATLPADISKVKTAGEPFIGNANAPVTMAYWTDYQCPFCQRNEEEVMPQIVKNYVDTGKVKIVFKDFAFLGQDSQTLAQYSRAVWETDPTKFYDWHKAIFDNQGKENTGWATKAKIDSITASVLGAAETAKVDSLVATKGADYQKLIDADKAEGASFGIGGTPGTIVGKQLIPGAYPYSTFQSALDAALKNA